MSVDIEKLVVESLKEFFVTRIETENTDYRAGYSSKDNLDELTEFYKLLVSTKKDDLDFLQKTFVYRDFSRNIKDVYRLLELENTDIEDLAKNICQSHADIVREFIKNPDDFTDTEFFRERGILNNRIQRFQRRLNFKFPSAEEVKNNEKLADMKKQYVLKAEVIVKTYKKMVNTTQ